MYRKIAQAEHWRLLLNPMTAPAISDTELGGTVSVDGAGGLSIHTGVMYGPVDVAVELLDEPTEYSGADWDDVVELSAQANESEPVSLVGIFSEADEVEKPDDGTPALAADQTYRVRVHVRGRDATDTDELIECDDPAKGQLLLLLWPADATAPEVMKMTSTKARSDGEHSDSLERPRAVGIGKGDPDRAALIAQNLREAGA